MNVNGSAAVTMTNRLRLSRTALVESPLDEDQDAARFIPICDALIVDGEQAAENWGSIVHSGGDLVEPLDAAGFMQEFTDWGEGATWLVAVVERLPAMDQAERAELISALDE
jgi:hypothetical protein